MAWQPHGSNQKRCEVHDEVFPKTTTCPRCPPGLGAPVAAITEVTTDKELGLLENELRTEARYYRKLGRDLCEGTDREIGYGLKAAEIALKYDRAYKDILAERKGREHDIWLVNENRKLQGKGDGD